MNNPQQIEQNAYKTHVGKTCRHNSICFFLITIFFHQDNFSQRPPKPISEFGQKIIPYRISITTRRAASNRLALLGI